jgi:hypothetical protein
MNAILQMIEVPIDHQEVDSMPQKECSMNLWQKWQKEQSKWREEQSKWREMQHYFSSVRNPPPSTSREREREQSSLS